MSNTVIPDRRVALRHAIRESKWTWNTGPATDARLFTEAALLQRWCLPAKRPNAINSTAPTLIAESATLKVGHDQVRQ